jgi:hypothetical protein
VVSVDESACQTAPSSSYQVPAPAPATGCNIALERFCCPVPACVCTPLRLTQRKLQL